MKTASNTLSSRNLRARHKTVKHESSYTERHWLLDKRCFLMADPFVVLSPSVRSSSSWLSNSLSSSLLSPSSSSSASIPSSAPNDNPTLLLAASPCPVVDAITSARVMLLVTGLRTCVWPFPSVSRTCVLVVRSTDTVWLCCNCAIGTCFRGRPRPGRWALAPSDNRNNGTCWLL